MKTASVLLAFALASAAALPAAANTAKTDASARSTIVQETTGGSSPKLICRRQESTGTRMGGERICLTKEQWRVVNNGGAVTTYQKRVR